MKKIDLIDRKILHLLTINSRFNIATIRKYVKLSPTSIKKRIENLEKNKIIKKYTCNIFRGSLGYVTHHNILIKLKVISPKTKDEIIDGLFKIQNIIKIYECDSNWNFLICISTKYPGDTYDSLNEVKRICQDDLLDIEIMQIAQDFNLKKCYFLKDEMKLDKINSPGSFHNCFYKNGDRPRISNQKIDTIDKKILLEFKENSRINLLTLSTKLNVPYNTVKYRIKKLIKKGILHTLTCLIDPQKLDFKKAFLFLKVKEKERKNVLLNHLKQKEESHYGSRNIGSWNHSYTFYFQNYNQGRELINFLRNEFSDIVEEFHLIWEKEEIKYDPFLVD